MVYVRTDSNGRVLEISATDNGGVATNALTPDIPDGSILMFSEGAFYVESVTPAKAEQESHRASAYRDRVDPITCEIQRLRDMGGTEAEIAEAEQRRAEAVTAIKEEFPYPASAGSADETAQDKPLPTLY